VHTTFALTEIAMETLASQSHTGVSIGGRWKGQRRRDAHVMEKSIKYQVFKYRDQALRVRIREAGVVNYLGT
jgi:hypothetical protein